MAKKKSYKEIHGETRVGKFLRSIGKSDIVAKAISVAGSSNPISGVLQVIGDILTEDTTLTKEQMEHAVKLLEMDMLEMEEITKRWEADLKSDSWLSKNIRPLTLATLVISTLILILLDGASNGFAVSLEWIELLKTALSLVFVAYFGSRGAEKILRK